jgi:hypothetical protein
MRNKLDNYSESLDILLESIKHRADTSTDIDIENLKHDLNVMYNNIKILNGSVKNLLQTSLNKNKETPLDILFNILSAQSDDNKKDKIWKLIYTLIRYKLKSNIQKNIDILIIINNNNDNNDKIKECIKKYNVETLDYLFKLLPSDLVNKLLHNNGDNPLHYAQELLNRSETSKEKKEDLRKIILLINKKLGIDDDGELHL